MALEPLAEKWTSFNWHVSVVDGHSHTELANAFAKPEGPHCIIANTTKGKGVSFMEDKVLWHYRPPSETDLINANSELGRGKQ
jgi:transketolase